MVGSDGVSVFIVDDHELFRNGLKEALEPEEDITVVGESGRFAGTIDLILELAPDVAVIDVRLGDGSGIELCRQLQEQLVGTRSLMFTSATGDEPLYQSILAGASGYLLKTASGQEIISAIRSLGAGRALIDPAVTNSLLVRLREQNHVGLEELTTQERRVLELIGEGLTNGQIAERLHLADQTVKNYVSHVLTKLNLNRPQTVLYADAEKRTKEESG
jgi:DNA-binding NarL/FixJ family response regulator